jgi:molybdate transport system substrate-binding protein
MMIKTLYWVALVCITLFTGCKPTSIDGTSKPEINLTVNPRAQSTLRAQVSTPHNLTVFAAASLTGAFKEIGTKFESANPGVKVRFNFAGSQILRTQIEQGALADVFASADHKNMDTLMAENLILTNTYHDFATNQMVVILPADNPGNVQTFGDLAKPNLKLVLADASVPAGNYARQIINKVSTDFAFGSDFSTKVLANVVSNETDVKQVVAKVELGEADAGIVYASDKVAAPNLATLPIPDEYNVIAFYPIAVLTDAPEPILARSFEDYVRSPAGQAILQKWGFGGSVQ